MAAPSTASTSYFDRVPNETLSLILSFVASPGVPLPYSPDSVHQTSKHPRTILLEPIFVIRWVSRRFRIIANDLDIWRFDSFDFTHGLSLLLRPCKQARHVRNWLDDKPLARSLLYRRTWHFHNLDVFYVIVMELPEVFHVAQNILLRNFPEGLNIVIDRLDQFSQLSDLRIFVSAGLEDPVNLSLITTTCPLLDTLFLSNLRNYYGSLEHASNLQYLSIRFRNFHNAIISSSLSPVQSADTLTSFDLTFDEYSMGNDLELLNFFAPYLNLNKLELEHLPFEFNTGIAMGKFTLTSLKINFAPEELTLDNFELIALINIVGLLSADSLRFLKQLSFQLDCDNCDVVYEEGDDGEEGADELWGDKIISGIVKLQYLEELNLIMGMRTSWCDRFAGLKNLKSLDWRYYYIQFSDLSHQGPMTLTEKIERCHVQAGNFLDEAFTEFAHKPHISLRWGQMGTFHC